MPSIEGKSRSVLYLAIRLATNASSFFMAMSSPAGNRSVAFVISEAGKSS